MSTRRVLFAIRNPRAARQPGLTKAIQAAKALDASLELFHALTDPLFIEYSRLESADVDSLRQHAEEEVRIPLARLCAIARRHGVPAASSVAWDYPAYEAVVRRAAAIGAELIIAECHHGARTRPWLVHLTDWELLRTSAVPVLLLRNTTPWRRPVVLAAVDTAHAHDKSAALDARIVTAARDLGARLNGELHVMHSAHPSLLESMRATPLAGDVMTWPTLTYAAYVERARIDFAKFFTGQRIRPTHAHLVPGDPTVTIPRLAKQLKAGMVVMGAVSRSGIKRVLIGNTAERVLESLPCDILVVKPEGFHTPIDAEAHGLRVEVPPPLTLTAP